MSKHTEAQLRKLGVTRRTKSIRSFDPKLESRAEEAAKIAVAKEAKRKIPKGAPKEKLGFKSADWNQLQVFGTHGQTASQYHGNQFSQAKRSWEKQEKERRGEKIISTIKQLAKDDIKAGMSEDAAYRKQAKLMRARRERNEQLKEKLEAQRNPSHDHNHKHCGRFIGKEKTLQARSILGRKIGDIIPAE